MDAMTATFRAYLYDPANDNFAWREFTRETLLDKVIREAFGARYGPILAETAKVGCHYQDGNRLEMRPHWRDMRKMLAHVLRGILADGLLSTAESQAVQDHWRQFWQNRKIA